MAVGSFMLTNACRHESCAQTIIHRGAKIAEKLAENGGALAIIAHGQSWPAPVICAVSARLFGVNARPISDLSLYPKSR